MKTKIYFVAILMAALSFTASAQFMNSTSNSGSSDNGTFRIVHGGFSSMSFDGESLSGGVFGIDLAFSINNSPLYALAGIQGSYNTKSESGVKISFIGADVPVSIGYKFILSEGNTEVSLLPYAGINARYYFSGKGSANGESIDLFSDTDMDGYAYKPFHFGAQIGTKVLIDKFAVGIEYLPYFTKLIPDYDKKISYFQISVGYTF